MSALTRAIRDTLQADSTLKGLLATYQKSGAAVFSDPPPKDAQLPYIVVSDNVTSNAFDTKGTRGREVTRDIRCYAPIGSDKTKLDLISERVFALLHRQNIAVTGFNVVIAAASGPFAAPEEPYAIGEIVSIRYIMMEA